MKDSLAPCTKDDQKWSSGPDKPIKELQDVVRYLKKLRDSFSNKMPYTSGRIQECILTLKKVQQRQKRN